MSIFVHPTARIDPTAVIRPGCWIGPNVLIGPDVVIGNYSVIGGMPEHREFYSDVCQRCSMGVEIMGGARIFEFVSIHAGTVRKTQIGRGAAVFNHSHIAHDVVLGDLVTVGGQVSIAGHVRVQFMANISGKSAIHQKVVVGAHSILAAMAFLNKDLPPGEKWIGSPARNAGANDIGLQRAGLTLDQCKAEYMAEFEQLKKEVRG